MTTKIPNIIHQVWIGDKPAPIKLMETWKNKHPNYEYIFWNEQEFQNRNIIFECQEKIDLIQEINGKADIIRWELLWKYGGVFIDADSICIEPLDSYFDGNTAFASFENEQVRPGLVATGTMGFLPNHPLCRDIIDWIKSDESTEMILQKQAWVSVGPGLLTRFLNTGKYKDFSVYPSHVFLPVHFQGDPYLGHKKIYAHQYWGSNYQLYDSMYFSQTNIFELPESLKPPEKWVSLILILSDITKIRECLHSIKLQKGRFGIEMIIINDEYIPDLEKELEIFIKTSRFIKLFYNRVFEKQNYENYVRLGKIVSTGTFVFLMDTTFIMPYDYLQKQIEILGKKEDIRISESDII